MNVKLLIALITFAPLSAMAQPGGPGPGPSGSPPSFGIGSISNPNNVNTYISNPNNINAVNAQGSGNNSGNATGNGSNSGNVSVGNTTVVVVAPADK